MAASGKVEIYSESGDMYTYDPNTDFITKNGLIVSSQMYQPVFVVDDNYGPLFSGIWNRGDGTVIGRSGSINPVGNSGSLSLI